MVSRISAFLLAAILHVSLTSLASASEAPPQRVVSMNLCTDQLAMMLAREDQLISVSYLAASERSSTMAEQAKAIGTNYGLAEQIFRLNPDLVLAGTFTTRATVNLLKRLGVRVEEFKPAYSLEDIRAHIERMGELLGSQPKATRTLTAFEADLNIIEADRNDAVRIVGSYGANSYTSGLGTLENEIVKVAGLKHMGEQLGLNGTSKLTIERLLRANPDYVMSWRHWSSQPGRSTEILRHPVLNRFFGENRRIQADSRYWICGLPIITRAMRQLQYQTQERLND